MQATATIEPTPKQRTLAFASASRFSAHQFDLAALESACGVIRSVYWTWCSYLRRNVTSREPEPDDTPPMVAAMQLAIADFEDGRVAGFRNKQNPSFCGAVADLVTTRNRRTVWTIGSQPQSEHHFAAFPEALVEPCLLAGCPRGGVVLDPFCGSGTTLVVAQRQGKSVIGLELNPQHIEIAKRRIFADVTLSRAEKKSGQKLLSLGAARE